MRYGCYANGFQFDSHLVDFTFLLFFGLTCYLYRLRLGLGFIFLGLLPFYQAYCTLIVRYCYVTGGMFISFLISGSTSVSIATALVISGDIFIVCNFIITHLQQVSCICSLSVHVE